MRSSQITHYAIPRSDRSIPPPAPQWLRTLSDPPPRLPEDDWNFIEHIRITGQIGSGSILGNDFVFDLPIYESDEPRPLDKNAPERLEAEKDAARRAHAAEELKKFLNSPEQMQKRRLQWEQRKRDRAAMEEEWKREREQWEADQKEQKQTQAERDAEWDEAGKKATRRIAEAHAQNRNWQVAGLAAVEARRIWEARQQQDAERRRVWEEQARRAAEERRAAIERANRRLAERWWAPQLEEVSVWWQSGKLAFLPLMAQPLEVDWHRLTGKLAVTVRNASGFIASVIYQEGTNDIALLQLMKTCQWLGGHKAGD